MDKKEKIVCTSEKTEEEWLDSFNKEVEPMQEGEILTNKLYQLPKGKEYLELYKGICNENREITIAYIYREERQTFDDVFTFKGRIREKDRLYIEGEIELITPDIWKIFSSLEFLLLFVPFLMIAVFIAENPVIFFGIVIVALVLIQVGISLHSKKTFRKYKKRMIDKINSIGRETEEKAGSRYQDVIEIETVSFSSDKTKEEWMQTFLKETIAVKRNEDFVCSNYKMLTGKIPLELYKGTYNTETQELLMAYIFQKNEYGRNDVTIFRGKIKEECPICIEGSIEAVDIKQWKEFLNMTWVLIPSFLFWGYLDHRVIMPILVGVTIFICFVRIMNKRKRKRNSKKLFEKIEKIGILNGRE